MNFCSDNVATVAPQILAAIEAANRGPAMPYGADAVTARLERQLADLFETDLSVFPVATGTAANVLALSAITPRYGAIFCHEEAHIEVDECGAPEFYTGGAKLVGLGGAHGKLHPDVLSHALASAKTSVHQVQPAAVSLSQATELGTIYGLQELSELSGIAHERGLPVHMDGARFANAVATLGCSAAEASWKSGVDILSLGATKGGAMAAEAVIVFNPKLADDLGFLRKRGGHLFSKMRFVSAQLGAWLEDGLWLSLATHANRMAQSLADGLRPLRGIQVLAPVEANIVFVTMPAAMEAGLRQAGFQFYRIGDRIRLVTAHDTDANHISDFLRLAKALEKR